MARQILGGNQQQQQRQQSRTSFRDVRLERATKNADPMAVRQALRKQRSRAYLDALTKLDASDNLSAQQRAKELLDAIDQEFDMVSLQIPSLLEGIVAKCYLGDPYEVHSLDMAGGIIEHFESWRKMPGKLEQVRGLAMNPAYEVIEVYSNYACAIDSRGNVSLIDL